MDQITQKEQPKHQTNPIAASVAGAVVGAGIAATGAMILKDEKNRKKVKQVLTHFKKQVVDYSTHLKKGADKKKSEIKESLAPGVTDSNTVAFAK